MTFKVNFSLIFCHQVIMMKYKGCGFMVYTIKQVSEIMHLHVSTIRYYDKEGLLPYIERKESGYRLFHESDIKMIQVIECFKRTGMPIKDIKQFIEYVKMGDDSLEARYQMFKEREAAVKQQMQDLEKQMELIQHKLWYYQTAIDAGTEENSLLAFLPSETDVIGIVQSDIAMEQLRVALREWKPWAENMLDFYLSGKKRTCNSFFKLRYGISERQVERYKAQFEEFVKKFLF